jgi:Tfp pilus assembly protein PilF
VSRLTVLTLALVVLASLLAGCLPKPPSDSGLPPMERLALAIEAGNDKKAAAIADRILSSPDATIETFIEVRDLYARADKSAQAIAVVQRALQALSNLPARDEALLHNYLAADSFALGDDDGARTEYELALKIDPESSLIANDYAYFIAERGGDLGRALRLAERALEDQPDHPTPLDTMGWVLHKMGEDDRALEYLERSARLEPRNPVVALHVGIVSEALGNREQAVVAYVASMDNAGSNENAAKEARERLSKLDPEAYAAATSLHREPSEPIRSSESPGQGGR